MIRAVVLVLAFGLLTGVAAQAEDTKLIVVNGVGERSVEPNMVTLTVEVWSRGNTAKQAQQMAASSFKNFKAVTEKHKIRKEDLRTENYSLNPDYEYDQKTRQNKIVGFRVSHTLSMILRKTDEVGALIDAMTTDDKKATQSGINISSIAWDSDKRSEFEGAALADAVKATRIKADNIAKAAGVKIKGVSKISHTSRDSGPVLRNMSLMRGAMESASTELPAGQIKIQVEVFAEYEI